MCGIAGILSGKAGDPGLIGAMIAPIAHRGPDDNGVWTDAAAGIGLGHRRLSIVDLSPLGHQPMASADERFVLSYNGEIYNHLDLRRELDRAGHRGWRGHSDTETLVEGIAVWGLEAALRRSVGMFALALWDRKERTLALARDRFGEKPLYYGWVNGDFAFASELKALRALPGFDNPVSRQAVKLYASRVCVPAPLSIYERVYKLDPGCILTITRDGVRTPIAGAPVADRPARGVALRRYWSFAEVVRAGLADPIESENDALERLEQSLAAAVRGQSIADVPVGAFLSGGIDSSTVVGLYQKYSSIPVRTFSIGFEEQAFNEADFAKAVARHFGTEHNERYVTVREAQEVIPDLPDIYDEPFADSSQIPTYLVSRFAREQVTVAISGDGGDELFGGYVRHIAAPALWRRIRGVPRPLRSLAGTTLSPVPPPVWDRLVRATPFAGIPYFGSKVHKTLAIMKSARRFDDVYATFLDQWGVESSPVRDLGPGVAACDFALDVGAPAPDATRMMYCDAVSYLPDDILCKVDRAAMAVSLETRVPFLDHRVAELSARIPAAMKIRGGEGKSILRKLLYREAPRALFERPKAGFGIPVGLWMRGPLRPWAEELLAPRTLREAGYFDVEAIQRRWRQHLRGERDASDSLWAVLMFQAWHARHSRTNHPQAEPVFAQ